MEALWNLEDESKLSTQQALLLLICAALGVGVLCTVTMLLRNKSRRKKLVGLQTNDDDEVDKMVGRECSEPTCGWVSIKRALMGSVRWSRASKWQERKGGSWRETPLPLLDKEGMSSSEFDLRWPSHNSDSPVWQRPILMGEKCELPRFSGLILYDENGQSLCDAHHKETTSCKITTNQEFPALTKADKAISKELYKQQDGEKVKHNREARTSSKSSRRPSLGFNLAIYTITSMNLEPYGNQQH